MFAKAFLAVRRLASWLSVHLGRPYHAVLGIGLVIEVTRLCHELVERPAHAGGPVRLMISILFFLLLLIHQVGELAERRAASRHV